MQVTPLPAPILPTAQPQDVAKTVPQVQAQAATPLTQRAVDPSPRSERGNQPRSNGEKSKGGQGGGDKRGGSVNIRV
jgi:hypothetical protein